MITEDRFAAQLFKRSIVMTLIALLSWSSSQSMQRFHEYRVVEPSPEPAHTEATGIGATIALSAPVLYDKHPTWAGEEGGMWCADPRNPQRLLGITNANEEPRVGNIYRVRNIVKLSEDGGLTWTQRFTTHGASSDFDPACTFGVDGTAYIATMAGYHGANVWRSSDGGSTWADAVRIDYPYALDRPHLVIDRSDSPWRGRLYIVGAGMTFPFSNINEIVVYSSKDNGRTFQGPVTVHEPDTGPGKGVTVLGNPVVLQDGTLIASWTEAYTGPHGMACAEGDKAVGTSAPCGSSAVKIAQSHDGGATFDAAILVAHGRYAIQRDATATAVGKWYPSVAADTSKGPFAGRLYIVWSDAGAGRQEVVFVRSIDSGKTWSLPRVISDTRAFSETRPFDGAHNTMATIAVNSRGVLGVMFYSQSTPPPRVEFRSVFSASDDGGVTWSAQAPVTTGPLTVDQFAPAWNIGRDETGGSSPPGVTKLRFPNYSRVPTCNFGMTVDARGDFRLFGFSNPTGEPEFTAVVARTSTKAKTRVPALDQVELKLGSYRYRKEQSVVEVSLAVQNISQVSLRLPIRVAVVDPFQAPMRVPSQVDFMNADNRRESIGAWWDFAGKENEKVLKPGQRTVYRVIRIRFKGGLESSQLLSTPTLSLMLQPLIG